MSDRPQSLTDLDLEATYWVIVRPQSTDIVEVVAARVVNRDPRWPGGCVSIKVDDGRIFDFFGYVGSKYFFLRRAEALNAAQTTLEAEAKDCDAEVYRLRTRAHRLRLNAAALRRELEQAAGNEQKRTE